MTDSTQPARAVDTPLVSIRPASTNDVARLASRYFTSRAFGWTLVLLIIAFWQVSSLIRYVPSLSSPSRILGAFYDELFRGGTLLEQLLLTLRTMAIGLAFAFPLGVVIGFLMGRVRVVWGALEPIVEIVRLTPATAILPILILFLGLGDAMKTSIFLITAIFPLILNSYAGARSVSRTLAETASTFQLTWMETQTQIALPAALPFILVGIRQAIGQSLVIAVVVGIITGNDGIGYYILFHQQAFNVPSLLAGVLAIAAVGYLLNAAFLVLEKRLVSWRSTDMGR